MDREQAELQPPPDWRKDPTGRHQYRLWEDGWTEHVSDFGVRAVDPYTGAPSTATLDAILGPAPNRPPVRRRAGQSTTATRMGGLAVVVGAATTVIGTFVPILEGVEQFTANYVSQNAFDDRGSLIALLAGFTVLLGLGIWRPNLSPLPAMLSLASSVIIVVVVYQDWRDVQDVLERNGLPGLGVASGLSVCIIGGILAVVGSVVALVGQGRR